MNRLSREASPYLRQHAQNPVDWYPWGDEALAAARSLDRPILLSVGYAACHWCHVMAHESFDDPEVASYMNEHFVCVKVDREERPDIDSIYMDVLQAMNGSGGWPMTMFLTPDARPFFGGTYFPPSDRHGMPSFTRVLHSVAGAWSTRRNEVYDQAAQLISMLETSLVSQAGSSEPVAARCAASLGQAIEELGRRFDPANGGFGSAPKFPHPALVELCLVHHRLSGEAGSMAMAEETLGAMARGGIYDHLGGGFARYSTDATWTVPHFEKMLYDQAGLAAAYLHAWQATARRDWLEVALDIARYVQRDLTVGGAAMCSSEDADSDGAEGAFYVWERSEVVSLLGADLAARVAAYYQLDGAPQFDGRYVLRRPPGASLERPREIDEARRVLLAARSKRTRPSRDEKVITEWNAMWCRTLAEIASATADASTLESATALGDFLLANLRRPDGRWLRSWYEGSARHLAYATDYAWLAAAFSALAEATGERRWVDEAIQVASGLVELFVSPTGREVFLTGSDAEALVVRPSDLTDGSTPSANATAVAALARVASLSGDQSFSDAALELVEGASAALSANPLAVAGTLIGGLYATAPMEVGLSGARPDMLAVVRTRYEPFATLLSGGLRRPDSVGNQSEGLAYVCRGHTCGLPASTPAELAERLDAEAAADRDAYARLAEADPVASSGIAP